MNPDFAGGWVIQAAEAVEQSGLAAAGAAAQGDELPLANFQIDIAQGMDIAAIGGIDAPDLLRLDRLSLSSLPPSQTRQQPGRRAIVLGANFALDLNLGL